MKKDSLLIEAGAKLRELRKNTGLSTYKVGKRVGVSGNYIGMIERGQKNPSEAILASLAEIYEVNREDVFSLYKRVANEELEQIMQLHPEIRKTMASISTSRNISDEEAIMIARRLEEITAELFQEEE